MKRLKSIDTLRGISMVWMMYGHLTGWWLTAEDHWLIVFTRQFFDFLGSGAFILIAGTATAISYQNRRKKAETTPNYSLTQVRNEYLLRAFFIYLIALGWNIGVVFQYGNITLIWNWFILQTIAFSLIIGWPLLRTTKLFRLILVAIIMILNQVFLAYLLPFEGQGNLNGILYYIFYGNLELDAIFSFFPYFIMGTVIGEIINDIYKIEDKVERKTALKNKLLVPLMIAGGVLIIIGISISFPNFLAHRTFSWLIYSMGVMFIVLSTFLFIEEFELIKTEKSYRFFYYFSYYSFTIYLAHNILFFLFLHQLTVITIWFGIGGTVIIMDIILRAINKSSWKDKAAIKIQLARVAAIMASNIEKKKLNSTK